MVPIDSNLTPTKVVPVLADTENKYYSQDEVNPLSEN